MGNAHKKGKFRDRKAMRGGHTKGKVLDVRWSPKEDMLLSVGNDSTCCVYRTGKFEKPYFKIQLPGPYATTGDMAKNRIVLAGTTKDISVYSAGVDDPLYSMKGHELAVSSVRFNRYRHEILLSSSLDGSIREWDMVRKTCSRIFRDDDHGGCTGCAKVAWASGNAGERVFLGAFEDATVHLFDGRSRSGNVVVFSGHDSDVNSVAWADDDSFFVSASSDSTVCVWDIKRPDKPLRRLGTTHIKGDAVDVSIRGGSESEDTFVYVAYADMPYFAVWPLGASSFDADDSSSKSNSDGSNHMSPALHKRVNCVEVSPSGKYFATGDWGSSVIIWDIEKTKKSDWHTTGRFEIY
jgi:WD40 repeat protein